MARVRASGRDGLHLHGHDRAPRRGCGLQYAAMLHLALVRGYLQVASTLMRRQHGRPAGFAAVRPGLPFNAYVLAQRADAAEFDHFDACDGPMLVFLVELTGMARPAGEGRTP